MAFTSRVRGILGQYVRRTAWVGLLCLLAAAFLSACDDGPTATPTTLPTETPGPIRATSTPTPTSVPPTSTPVPTPTPDPTLTPTPVPTPTPEQVSAPAIREYDINAGTLWGQLFDTFTTSEQSCIRTELGDDLLESVLERRAMSEGDTEQWEASIFGCLAPETAAGIFLSALVAQMEGLTDEAEGCLRELLADADVAGIIAGTLPDASPATATAAMEFTVGLLSCVPEQMLSGSTGPPDPPQAGEFLLWRYSTGGWVVNAPTVADGVVYVGSDDNHVYALDAETGELLWRFETGGVIRSTPTVTSGAVYVGSNDNHVYALDAESGELLWSYDTGNWVQYSPVASGGMVYLGALADGDYRVHALDAVSGEQAWVAEAPYPFGAEFTVTVAGGKLYTWGEFGEFYALDATAGEMVWSFSAGMGAESPPTVIGGVVYLTAANTAYVLDESTGELVWSYGTERLPARDFPAVVADNVYYFSPDDHIYALDTATGELLWSYEADKMINTASVTAEGMVYAGSESGRFYALDAATGGLVWSREPMAWALQSPMVTGGVLYAESSDGHLRALNAATGEDIWQFQKGYFDGIPSYIVAGGFLYVGSLDGSVYSFSAPSGTTKEKVLTILYWQAPTLPGPYLSAGTKDVDAGAITLEPLAKYDPDGNLVAALAAQIPTIENGGFSQDLMSITWKLKEGLKWSDGSDMTAEDVAFSWLYCVDEETGCTSASSFDGIAFVQALDDLTVKITFDAPHALSVPGLRQRWNAHHQPGAVCRLHRRGRHDLRRPKHGPVGHRPLSHRRLQDQRGGRLRAQPPLPGRDALFRPRSPQGRR